MFLILFEPTEITLVSSLSTMKTLSPTLGFVVDFGVTWFAISLRSGTGHATEFLFLTVPALVFVLLDLVNKTVDIRTLLLQYLLCHYAHGLIRIADKKVNYELC